MFNTSLVEVSLSESVCAPPQHAVLSAKSTFSAPAASSRSSMKCGCDVDSLPGPRSFSGKNMPRARIHAAVVVGDLETFERILDALLELLFADALLDPVERVDGFELA